MPGKTTHGHSQPPSRTYRVWGNMIERCRAKPGTKAYDNYVARGIKVCERWMVFANFLADMGECPPSPSGTGRSAYLTLERKDNMLGYFKENCIWAPYRSQNANRRPVSEWKSDGRHAPGDWSKRQRDAGGRFR